MSQPPDLEVMGFSAAQQPDAPALPLRHVVLDHTQLAVALHMERLQPYFAARVQLLHGQRSAGSNKIGGNDRLGWRDS